MSRARTLADYVSSGDELALKAPITNAALVTPNLGTPSAGVMTNVTGMPLAGLSATGTAGATTFLRGDNAWAAAGGGVDGITSSANANAINIDSSERVIMKAQPMMLATGVALADQTLTTSLATITFFSATTTDCFIRGITFSSGVAEVPIAGRYYISLEVGVDSLADQDRIEMQLTFESHENRLTNQFRASGQSTTIVISGIFPMNASETVTAQIRNLTDSNGGINDNKKGSRMSMLYIGE